MSLGDLPAELQSLILHNLPLPTLLTFALTSKRNYELARSTLSTLNLAVFPKRIHGVLAFLNVNGSSFLDAHENSTRYQIVVSTAKRANDQKHNTRAGCKAHACPQTPINVQRLRRIQEQNDRLEQVMSSPISLELSSLTIHTYSMLSSSLSLVMAKSLPRLRHLTLNFSHPYIHDPALPARYWETCPDASKEGSPAWNAFASLGDGYAGVLRMKSLQTLNITRAAITSVQLSKWISVNRDLREIRLDMVAGIDQSFIETMVQMWANQRDRSLLKTLVLHRCPNLILQRPEDFEWLHAMLAMGLAELDFGGCENVNAKVLKSSCEDCGWTSNGPLRVIGPDQGSEEMRSLNGEALVPKQKQAEQWSANAQKTLPTGQTIEVDPAYVALE